MLKILSTAIVCLLASAAAADARSVGVVDPGFLAGFAPGADVGVRYVKGPRYAMPRGLCAFGRYQYRRRCNR